MLLSTNMWVIMMTIPLPLHTKKTLNLANYIFIKMLFSVFLRIQEGGGVTIEFYQMFPYPTYHYQFIFKPIFVLQICILKWVFPKNERVFRLNATKKGFWLLLILLLSVALTINFVWFQYLSSTCLQCNKKINWLIEQIVTYSFYN